MSNSNTNLNQVESFARITVLGVAVEDAMPSTA